MARVFISFATDDQQVAEAVKYEIERRLSLQGQVFMSSDPTQLVAGEDWFARIKREIVSSEVVLLMLSRRGVRRPWVNFEAGAAWLSEKHLIPICYGKMTIESLPKPYSSLHALSLPSQKDFLVKSVAKHLGLPPPPSSLFAALGKVSRSGNSHALARLPAIFCACDSFTLRLSPRFGHPSNPARWKCRAKCEPSFSVEVIVC
jgi:hypothetical protein